ncbi:MAG: DUF86 domain-containing protein [Caldilineaceae bacterium]|nr:DUF86 domain-containing protein [Caldilineaceae bacterium]
MSEEAHAGRHWRFYVQDMIDFSEKVLAYTDGMDLEDFLADELRYDATLRNLKLIGEAAAHIPQPVRLVHAEIPWHAIIGTRNRLAHAYMAISDSIIWGEIQDAIPDLLPALRHILDTTSDEAK